jgi:uncharacterized repeat protein (TIGR01451 family)
MSTIRANAIVDASGGNTATINGITPIQSSDVAALVTSTVAGVSAGDVGTYIYAVPNNSTVYATGATIAGSLLLPSTSYTYDATSGGATAAINGSALSGTWRCMGNRNNNNGVLNSATLWLRIS